MRTGVMLGSQIIRKGKEVRRQRYERDKERKKGIIFPIFDRSSALVI
jgi:hypothetical protein